VEGLAAAVMAWLGPILEALAPLARAILAEIWDRVERPQPGAYVEDGDGPGSDVRDRPEA